MTPKLYMDFPPTTNTFLIPVSQQQMFVALKDYKPDVYAKITEGVKLKKEKNCSKNPRKTIVTIYGDYNDGHCPKQLTSFEDFAVFKDYDVRTEVAPQIHNSSWITDSISVIAHH